VETEYLILFEELEADGKRLVRLGAPSLCNALGIANHGKEWMQIICGWHPPERDGILYAEVPCTYKRRPPDGATFGRMHGGKRKASYGLRGLFAELVKLHQNRQSGLGEAPGKQCVCALSETAAGQACICKGCMIAKYGCLIGPVIVDFAIWKSKKSIRCLNNETMRNARQ
jgi:hypothetical protein